MYDSSLQGAAGPGAGRLCPAELPGLTRTAGARLDRKSFGLWRTVKKWRAFWVLKLSASWS